MIFTWLLAAICLAGAVAEIVPVQGERKVADENFLKRQKLILKLFVGLGHDDTYKNQYSDFDILANAAQFTDPKYAKVFVEKYKEGFVPKQEIFSLSCHKARYQAMYLFDLFFFAKDFETFYQVASWAKTHINPVMFAYTYTLAIFHRPDTRGYYIPPIYEIFPNYFVPQDTMHRFYDYKMTGMKQAKFAYNNTGYEYNYHDNMFGGPLSLDVYNPHSDYKVSYFREDVQLNSLYPYAFRFPNWLTKEKYNIKPFRAGEYFYIGHQQLLARYTMERIANGLPYVQPFSYDKPIQVGYNPRVTHFNGEAFVARPDGYSMDDTMHKYYFEQAKKYEYRLMDAIDFGGFWNVTTDNFVNILSDDGFDQFAKLVIGKWDHYDQNAKYFGSYYYAMLDALGHMTKTRNSINFNGGATVSKFTTLRDPAYYNFLVRLIAMFQKFKSYMPAYTAKELGFPGVSVVNFEVDKLMTYFDMFDYEVTNGIAFNDPQEFKDYKYYASQYRLNHKPYNYKVTVNSDASYDGIVRVFIAPKYDAEYHELTLEQQRMMYVEIDRFLVKIKAGENIFERNSKESPIFSQDQEGFRAINERLNKALKNNEPFYINDRATCHGPQRLQLPRGTKSGFPYTFAVVVSPYTEVKDDQVHELFCGSYKYFDHKPYGFPWDRPIKYNKEYHVPNIFYKDVPVYHNDDLKF